MSSSHENNQPLAPESVTEQTVETEPEKSTQEVKKEVQIKENNEGNEHQEHDDEEEKKEVQEEEILNESAEFILNEEKNRYYGGDDISGSITLDVTDDTFLHELRVVMLCDVLFKDSLNIVNHERLYRDFQIIAKEKMLSSGKQEYHFAMTIPSDGPCSSIIGTKKKEADDGEESTHLGHSYREVKWMLRAVKIGENIENSTVLGEIIFTKGSFYKASLPPMFELEKKKWTECKKDAPKLNAKAVLSSNVFDLNERISGSIEIENGSKIKIETVVCKCFQKFKMKVANQDFKPSPRQTLWEEELTVITDSIPFDFELGCPTKDFDKFCFVNSDCKELSPSMSVTDLRTHVPQSGRFRLDVTYCLQFTLCLNGSADISFTLPFTVSQKPDEGQNAKAREHRFEEYIVEEDKSSVKHLKTKLQYLPEYGYADCEAKAESEKATPAAVRRKKAKKEEEARLKALKPEKESKFGKLKSFAKSSKSIDHDDAIEIDQESSAVAQSENELEAAPSQAVVDDKKEE